MGTPRNLTHKERFMLKVRKSSSGCYEWQASKTPKGYGKFKYPGQSLAHRIAWILFKGEIPNEVDVCHQCDNPSCVNPDHLWLGTHKDNNIDRNSKNRQAKATRNGRSKLREVDVLEIYLSKSSSNRLSKVYGVDPKTIWDIKKGINWKTVTQHASD